MSVLDALSGSSLIEFCSSAGSQALEADGW